MDIFGTPTEIKISVIKAITELQNTASDIFVYEKKICDHVVYDKSDKDLLVKQTLFDLTFLGVLAQTGSTFALLQSLIVQVSSENLKPAVEPKQKNPESFKARIPPVKNCSCRELNLLFALKNIGDNPNDVFGTPTEIKISVMKAIAELQYTASDIFVYDKKICDHVVYDKSDEDLLVKQTLFDLTILGVLVRTGSSFALRQNLIVQDPSENLKRAVEPKQKKKVLRNVKSKVKDTNHKKKQNFEDEESAAEIDALYAFYIEEFKNIKTINNPESSKARTPSRLGSTGLDDDIIILELSAPLNDQTSKPMENVVENVKSKRKITIAKEIGQKKKKKKLFLSRTQFFI
ncbi:uncharacterized protein LOC117571241 isoform X1 [Drosophila albomicans]|uniref:Uncharacterized protein LOC117571241 isoform X1 n=1 Tax=Drosophila albomicans TaxID=7291 RepID=A0A6P8XAU6_DROAB|nr:uncharacterized protein LOC117571241 isoform X1 [Drosophila albomicans]